MSRKGGYKIIDLKGLDFSSNIVIDGIHEDIEDNYGKPLLFSGIVIDGVEKDDVFANVVVNGDGYDVTLYGQTLHISNVDVVSKKFEEIKTFRQPSSNSFLNLPNGIYDVRLDDDQAKNTSYSMDKAFLIMLDGEIEGATQPTSEVNGNILFGTNFNSYNIYMLVFDTFILIVNGVLEI